MSMDRPEPMVSMYEKTLTLTSASQRCEQLFIERLARLRTLGNYHGEVVVLDYGIDNRWNCSIKEVIKKNGGFYHRMGDVGYKDESGRVWFCGRKSHRVETSDGTFFTVPCEAVFNVHPKVYRTALVGAKGKPVLCVELEKNIPADKEQIREELLALGSSFPHTSGIKTILFHPGFPVDIRHNAKIFREKLAAWARSELS